MKSQNTNITDLFVIIHEPIYIHININAILRKIKKFDLCHQNKALIFIDICITKFTVCFSLVIGIKIALEKKYFFFIKCVRISKKITLYIIEAIYNDSHY